MTSSIFPILDSLSAPVITDPGSGYTTTPTVTIDPPSSGSPATGTAVIGATGVIDTISVIGGTNSGYTDGEEITIAASGSTTTATAIAVISGGIIQSISFTNRGVGYAVETLVITGVDSGINTATFDVESIAANAVSSITITDGGKGYTSLPNIVITGGGGTDATATAVFNVKSGVIAANTNILHSPITITSDLVKPGGGGIVRLYFSLNISTTTNIKIFNNGNLKGFLNADNTNDIEIDGYYRFDLDVEAEDNLNFQSTQSVNTVNFTRAHLVQFGA